MTGVVTGHHHEKNSIQAEHYQEEVVHLFVCFVFSFAFFFFPFVRLSSCASHNAFDPSGLKKLRMHIHAIQYKQVTLLSIHLPKIVGETTTIQVSDITINQFIQPI
eukprot:m.17399 g.17399  ORF g.17399 m.17399 type:complete len:106 (+) comp8281_c0_seq1:188-505(+)